VTIADPARGAGADGLTPDGINVNEGAESTLMWLTALEHIRALRGGPSSRRPGRLDRSAGTSRRSRLPSARGADEPRIPVLTS
jgi:hypothetical protein